MLVHLQEVTNIEDGLSQWINQPQLQENQVPAQTYLNLMDIADHCMLRRKGAY